MTATPEAFFQLFDQLEPLIGADEILLACARSERSDFVQFSRSRIRNAGSVSQYELDLRLIQGQRQVSVRLNLGGVPAEDLCRCKRTLAQLRQQVGQCPQDPWLLIHSGGKGNSESIAQNRLLPTRQIAAQISSDCKHLDLVGLLCCGDIASGFANTFGQRNWHRRTSFNFSWSCHLGDNRSAKAQHSGFEWDTEQFRHVLGEMTDDLGYLRQRPVSLSPETYRVYLAPAAVHELISTLAWSGFGARNLKTRQSPLNRLIGQEVRLHPDLEILENAASGLAPGFTPSGFARPDTTQLVSCGEFTHPLVAPRSAREYGMTVNCEREIPDSLEIQQGTLDQDRILDTLQDGLLINNLWYSNFSDLNQCAITGMTRFACFQVKNGAIRQPIRPLRFDDSLYALLGTQLHAITRKRQWIMDSDTYERRSLSSMNLPGLLIEQMRFTL